MTTLIDFADALTSKLRAALSDVPTITFDAPLKSSRSVRVPAIYLEMADFEPIEEAGDTRVLVDVRFEARCIVDPNTPRADLMLRALAGRAIVALHEIRRPVPGHGHIRLSRAGDDDFRPDMDGYLVWVVEFGIEIALGELEPEGTTPTEIYLGQAPAIGEGHADDYTRIA